MRAVPPAEFPPAQAVTDRRAHPAEEVTSVAAQVVDLEGRQPAEIGPREPGQSGHPALDLLGEVNGEVTGRRVGEVPPHLVHGPHRVERREHRPRDVVPVPPRSSAEGDLDDLLSGAEAVEHLAPREALGPEAIVDRAAVVVAEVTAWRTGRLVDREVGRPCERQCDTTESGASAAVGPELRPSVHGVARHPRRLRR